MANLTKKDYSQLTFGNIKRTNPNKDEMQEIIGSITSVLLRFDQDLKTNVDTESVVVIAHDIFKYFRDFTISDLEAAFKAYHLNKLEMKEEYYNHYRHFSELFITRILTAYRSLKAKHNILKDTAEKMRRMNQKPKKSLPISEEAQNKLRKKHIQWAYEYFLKSDKIMFVRVVDYFNYMINFGLITDWDSQREVYLKKVHIKPKQVDNSPETVKDILENIITAHKQKNNPYGEKDLKQAMLYYLADLFTQYKKEGKKKLFET